jgi:threonine aldolase
MPTPIDFRSDTVTRPTPAMRQAMAQAEVGDDVLGDDPTVIRLQNRVAEIMGKEAAVFVPSGTMANQTSIRAHTEPGDEVLAHEGSHIIHYETGGPAALSSVMVRPLSGEHGIFDEAAVDEAVRPRSSHFACSKLLVIENTHNRGGGTVWPLDQLKRVAARARHHGLKVHLDGARIWNACAATGLAPKDYAQHFDTVSCCFSKGLGAPAGSAVCGDAATITRVHRFRKMFGGTMRQSGILAAAALHALDHHRERLKDDHASARRLADGVAGIPGIRVDLDAVQTNMVFLDLAPSLGTAAEFCQKLEKLGVRMLPNAPRRIRAVCHLDVRAEQIPAAIEAIAQAAGARAPAHASI